MKSLASEPGLNKKRIGLTGKNACFGGGGRGGGRGDGLKIENEKIKVGQLMSSGAPCCESGLSGIVRLLIIISFIFSSSTTPNPIFSYFS